LKPRYLLSHDGTMGLSPNKEKPNLLLSQDGNNAEMRRVSSNNFSNPNQPLSKDNSLKARKRDKLLDAEEKKRKLEYDQAERKKIIHNNIMI